jgi:hypothetical protein
MKRHQGIQNIMNTREMPRQLNVIGIVTVLFLLLPGASDAANCLLKTGFNPGISVELKPNSDVGYLKGRDSVTGYALTNWANLPAFLKADLGALGPIPENIVFGIVNLGGAQGNVLSMQCFKSVPGARFKTRARYSLEFKEAPRFTQAYVKYRMMLHPAYREALRATNGWFQVFEFKDYRLRDAVGAIDRRELIHTLHVNVNRHGDRFHYFAGWRTINPAHEIWRVENNDISVRFGEWFTVEIFLKPGPAGSGRFLYRIDGQTVVSVADRDVQYKNSPLHTFEIFKLYQDSTIIDWMRNNGTPCQAWYDDLEYWDDMPGAPQ